MTWWAKGRPHWLVTLDRNWPCPCAVDYDHTPAPTAVHVPVRAGRNPLHDWPGDRWRMAA